MGKQQYNSA